MATITESIWQELMDRAYEKWTTETMSYAQFLTVLDAKERQAVLLGNMNYQINNGGVRQWVDNGYACHANEALAILSLIGTTNVLEWHDRLKVFVNDHVNTQTVSRGFVGDEYWKYELTNKYTSEYDRRESAAHEHASKLDDFYYSQPFITNYLAEITAFLSDTERCSEIVISDIIGILQEFPQSAKVVVYDTTNNNNYNIMSISGDAETPSESITVTICVRPTKTQNE